MKLEEPAHGRNSEGHDSRIYWIDDVVLDGLVTVDGKRLRHLKTIVMHEFGHTIGLYDLYAFPGKYPGYLMDTEVSTTIPLKDEKYAKQLYRNQHGGIRH